MTIIQLLLELANSHGCSLRIIHSFILKLVKILHPDDEVGEPRVLIVNPLPFKHDTFSLDYHMKLSFVGLLLRTFHADLVAGAYYCDHKVGEDNVSHDHDDKPEDPSEGLVLRVFNQLLRVIVA
jgi:hypothetical protein